MSWTLHFWRRSGEPPLIVEEVDPYLKRQPRIERDETPADPALPEELGAIWYRYRNPLSEVEFGFRFQEPPEKGEAEGDEAEGDYEETGLTLVLPSLGTPETAQEAIPLAAETAQALGLLVSLPQTDDADQSIPTTVDPDLLIRSYLEHSRSAAETLTYARERSRRNLAIGTAFLVAGLLMLLLAALSLLPRR